MNAKEKYAKYKKSRPKLTSTAKYTLGATYSTKGLSDRAKMAWFLDGILALEDAGITEREGVYASSVV
jgi:hypothetical protein